MRVLWLAYGDLRQPTGGYIYDRLVVDGLRAAGDEVSVRDPRDEVSLDGATVVVGDALCVPELGPLFERIGGAAARILLVHHFPSWEIERDDAPAMRTLEGRTIAASDLLIATGGASATRLRRDVPSTRVDVVVPGADRLPLVAGSGATHPGEAASLLSVGSLVARKRLLTLIDAFAPLVEVPARTPPPRLVVVGDPAREPDYAAAVAARVRTSAALRAQVQFRGVVDDGALAAAMAETDALVVPSSLEGYGMVIAEALRGGTPVVASREAAEAAGVVDHPAVTILGAESTWTGALERVTCDLALREAMRAAARTIALPRWREAVVAFRQSLTAAAGAAGAAGRSSRAPADAPAR